MYYGFIVRSNISSRIKVGDNEKANSDSLEHIQLDVVHNFRTEIPIHKLD